ncbi:tail fiber domain-containing protein [Ewingella sp. AOP9-I1-14]
MAWYRDGTVRVTNGSATVTGTGTLWGDNKQGIGPGQMLLVPAAGTVQVYEILRVDSNTQLTLKDNFVGTTSAASVYAIPSFYTDSVPDFARRLSAQLGYYQSQMDGWQQIMTGSGSVTLTTPNGQTVTISSFKKLTDDMSGKASNTDPRLSTVDGKSGGRISTSVDVTNELGVVTDINGLGYTSFKFPTTLARLCYSFTENLGDLVMVTTDRTLTGTEKYFAMRKSGQFTTQGNITCLSLTQTSDADKKGHITPIENALDKLSRIRGVTYVMKDDGTPSAGVIAQELMNELPEAVGSTFDDYDQYGEVEEEVPVEVVNENGEKSTITEIRKVIRLIRKRDDSKRSYTVEYSGVIALAVQAINELSEKVKSLEAEVASLKPQQAS